MLQKRGVLIHAAVLTSMAKRLEQENLQRWMQAYTAVAKGPSGKPTRYRVASGAVVELDHNCHAVWCALLITAKDLRGDRASSWASVEALAHYACIGTTNAKAALSDLVDVGLIRRKRRPEKQTSVTLLSTHQILSPEGWDQSVTAETEEADSGIVNLTGAEPKLVEPAPRPTKRVKQNKGPDVEPLVSLVKRHFDAHETFTSKKKEADLVKCLQTCVKRLGSLATVYKLLCLVFIDKSEDGTKILYCLRRSDNLGPYIVSCLNDWFDRHRARMAEPDTVESAENTQGVGA